MAIAFRAAGTRSKVASGDMTPGLPSGWQADDVHFMIACCQNGETAAIASGWSSVGSVNNNGGGSNTQVTLLWRRAVGGDTGPTVTGAGSGSISGIVGFSGCTTSGTPFGTVQSNDGSDSTSLTATALSVTPGASTDMVVVLGGYESGLSAGTIGLFSGTDPTYSEGLDDTNSLGANWTQLFCDYGTTSGAATGDRTATISATTSATWVTFHLALIAAGAGGAAYNAVPLLDDYYRMIRRGR